MNRAREKPVKVGLLQSYRRSARSLSSCISATPMPASLAAPSARCASCGPISAALSATLSARSRNPLIEAAFAPLLALARRVRDQEHGQRDSNVYSLHAPEVECIGKGKPHKPYEFGVKVSVTTTLKRYKRGQFAIPGAAGQSL